MQPTDISDTNESGAEIKNAPAGPIPPQQSTSKKESKYRQTNIQLPPVSEITGAHKNQLDVHKTLEQIRTLQLKNEKDRMELIERSLVKKFFRELYTIETTEFLTMGEKLSPEIASLFGVDDSNAVLDVGKFIQREVSKTLERIELAMDKFLKSFQIEES